MSSFPTATSSSLSQALENGTPALPAKPKLPATMVITNPKDGAVIFFTPDAVIARADDGHMVAFYPKTLDYSYQYGNDMLGDFTNGNIAVANAHALVLIDGRRQVNVVFPDGRSERLGNLGDPLFDAERTLVDAGIIDRAGWAMLKQLYQERRNLSDVSFVRADFDPSTDAMLEDVQRRDILANYAPPQS